MALPFFYITEFNSGGQLILNEDTSRHVVQVLRMQNGEALQLTDGKGNLLTATITDNNRKRCAVQVTAQKFHPRTSGHVSIAVSPVKNNSRFEWLLEKATEIGVSEIIPLICTRTEKQHARFDRMQGILVSAMLQSQQVWLPRLREPVKFKELVTSALPGEHFIAHCEDENSKVPLSSLVQPLTDRLILIGPEGDFTKEEIELALQNNFRAVTLGNTRLRTETAAIVAASLLCLV